MEYGIKSLGAKLMWENYESHSESVVFNKVKKMGCIWSSSGWIKEWTSLLWSVGKKPIGSYWGACTE